MKSGIYKIVNKVNGKYYIGSSNDIDGRWREHINDLKANRHHNVYLQRSWNKYGGQSFEFLLLELISPSELLRREQEYLDVEEARQVKRQCYNLKFVAGPGGRFSEETRQKLSESKMGKKNPNYGKAIPTEVKTKMSLSHLGSRNGRCDKTIYRMIHEKSGNIFEGTRYDFRTKYKIDRSMVYDLIHRNCKVVRGWKLA